MTVPYHRLLTEDEQRAMGVTAPAAIAMADRVHHDELDVLMHVNNVVYYKWLERQRLHLIRELNIGDIKDDNSPKIVIRSAEIRYVEEMLLGEDYVITTRPLMFRNTSITIEQIVWAAGRVRAEFRCVIVLLTPDGKDRLTIPDNMRAQLTAQGAVPDTNA